MGKLEAMDKLESLAKGDFESRLLRMVSELDGLQAEVERITGGKRQYEFDMDSREYYAALLADAIDQGLSSLDGRGTASGGAVDYARQGDL